MIAGLIIPFLITELIENGRMSVSDEDEVNDAYLEQFGKLHIWSKLYPLWLIYRTLNCQHIVTALEHENSALSQVMKSAFAEEEHWQKIMDESKKKKLTF